MIHLALGRLELDWGKNNGFNDHSPLFQESDVADVPYYYAGDELAEPASDGSRWQIITEHKEGLSKPLPQVMERLHLLGYSKAYARKEFEYLLRMHEFVGSGVSYDMLERALTSIDLKNMSADYGEGGEDFGKFFRREIAPKLDLAKLVGHGYQDFDLGYAMENLTPYSVLHLVANNPTAMSLSVNWQFNDLAENGWAKRSDFVCPLAPVNKFLIVTEGSSDAHIIRHAFKLLRPHISDFFDYVDMQEGYPFTGTGNVFRFVQGLISISVQNNVIVLYDNDAEGTASFQRTQELNVPENMRILRLPNLPAFSKFSTQGPNGHAMADINGRAAAIECYLDLGPSPSVRWTSYSPKIDAYQGELVGKEQYTREFLKQRERLSGYNYEGIEAVLDMIVATCASMKETARIAELAQFAGPD